MLTEVILSVEGVIRERIEFAGDALEAKKCIKKKIYDLVILDINLPERAECLPAVGGGLAVLHFIKNNDQAKPPGFLVGMTAFDNGEEVAQSEFSSPIWKLVRFSYQSDEWKKPLQEAVKYLISAKRPPFANDGFSYHVDVAIFTALQEEADSFLNMDIEWKLLEVQHDSGTYYQGRLTDGERSISAVLAVAPQMGMPTAAVVASKIIHSFRPRILAVAGICAGVRGKTKIGDILVADPCFDWGGGKWIRDLNSGQLAFLPAAYQWRLDESIRSIASGLSRNTKLLDDMFAEFHGKAKGEPPCVYVNAMASGASVLQAATLMSDVREQHKNLIGLEMESYAIFTAAELASNPRPLCVAVKSVCDFGDESKADDAHRYAAYTSARFVCELALQIVGRVV
ncbi:5'-methylthioadenosine/S-adenosylhomocysteine nucleosidase [Xanthomonas sacchari]|nr:5'-methylthioadenosine/S-adenosylhomocysteine nucleosidase [Xanthomonas sacchari]